MLYKLSFKNIKKSFKDYAIYFTTLILGVCIFYIFNSIDSQSAMLNVSARQDEMIELLTQILSYVSVFVSFILGFLIIYASRFLIKKRNKEFGIYMTLGMSKRKISILLLFETFIIGIISLFIGLGLGVVLSQITSIFVANMFEADMTKFQFNYSSSATIKTIIYFGVIYFIVMIFNTIIINKNKLINLLNASKRSEKLKLKNPIVCIILFVLSILTLGTAYYMVTDGVNDLLQHEIGILLIPISLGVIGTILFFYSVAGMLLKVLSRCHNLYSRKLNTFVFKQISSKINSMVISISVICLMLFFTLCLLSSAFTVKSYFDISLDDYAPVDFELRGIYSDEIPVIDLKKEFVDSDKIIKKNTKDITVVDAYMDQNFTFGKSFGNYEEEIRAKYPFLEFKALVNIVSESDYNKVADLYQHEKIHLNDGEYPIVSNFNSELYEETIKRNSIITIYGNELKPARDVINGFIDIGGNPTNNGFFVVKDEIIPNGTENIFCQLLLGNYNTDDMKVIDKIENKIKDFKPEYPYTFDTRNEIKENSAGLSTIVTFIGLYLGIIFLISSSAILALKSLSDCIDDKSKYRVLRQIGVDDKDINKSLFMQELLFFMMPFSLAIVHTLVGLKFCTFILSSLGINDIFSGSIMTFIFLIIIYGIYFIVTYLCSKNIIKENN